MLHGGCGINSCQGRFCIQHEFVVLSSVIQIMAQSSDVQSQTLQKQIIDFNQKNEVCSRQTNFNSLFVRQKFLSENSTCCSFDFRDYSFFIQLKTGKTFTLSDLQFVLLGWDSGIYSPCRARIHLVCHEKKTGSLPTTST